jgi:GH15 family glucan-1,4-alpha-glucosidase
MQQASIQEKIMKTDNLNYGLIGNCKTAAVISDRGSIDFFCLPVFSSFTVFAKLLDEKIGGSFSFEVAQSYKVTQAYLQDTNILITRFTQKDNIFEVHDFMPRYRLDHNNYYCPPDLIRWVKHISGKPSFRVKYDPQMCYAKNNTESEEHKNYIKTFNTHGEYESMYLYSNVEASKILNKSKIRLTDNVYFVLSYNEKVIEPSLKEIHLQYQKTFVYWLEWMAMTNQIPLYNEEVKRSALVLKLLTYEKTGALIAAVTTSLPETLGEVRNWDYRFCWLRDASMTVSVLVNLGHTYLARSFLNFVVDVIPFKNEKIQIMYGIHGEKMLHEEELSHLSGYKGSKPVRIGNAAYKQGQHDIYGILAELIYYSMEVYYQNLDNIEDLWTIIRSLVRHVEKCWTHKDHSIWEFRVKKEHYVFSKVLCWVALDRSIKIAHLLGKKDYKDKWTPLRDRIHADICKKGWNEKIGAFTQYYGGEELDSANLLMLDYGFLEANDPRYIKTVEKIYDHLCVKGLMYRYNTEDDFGVPKSSFTVCTFWMIHSLYRIGRTQEAKDMFDQVLSYGNHLGLFSEDIDFKTKRLLGNFPQAYSHIFLIHTAMVLSLDESLKEEGRLKNLYAL